MFTMKLLTLPQAAEYFSVTVFTIRLWIAQGKIPSVKMGGRRYIPETELNNLITDKTHYQR